MQAWMGASRGMKGFWGDPTAWQIAVRPSTAKNRHCPSVSANALALQQATATVAVAIRRIVLIEASFSPQRKRGTIGLSKVNPVAGSIATALPARSPYLPLLAMVMEPE